MIDNSQQTDSPSEFLNRNLNHFSLHLEALLLKQTNIIFRYNFIWFSEHPMW